MIQPRSFRYHLDEATSVATLTLDRPDRLNALTFDVYDELKLTFDALDTEPGVRAMCRGVWGNFPAGERPRVGRRFGTSMRYW